MKMLFESKEQIEGLIKRADNKDVTKNLTEKFRLLKKERSEFYLTSDELEEIFEWKLRGQLGRQSKRRKLNTNENIISITRTAFGISHDDKDYETQLKLKILTAISGVEIPVASAILTLCYPEEYAVIDVRNWNYIYKPKKRRTNYTPKQYTEYLKIIRKNAEHFNLTFQDIDIAVWVKYEVDMKQKQNGK